MLYEIGSAKLGAYAKWGSSRVVELTDSETVNTRPVQSVKARTRTTTVTFKGETTVTETHEQEIKMYSAPAALVKLGEHMGMFVDKGEGSVDQLPCKGYLQEDLDRLS